MGGHALQSVWEKWKEANTKSFSLHHVRTLARILGRAPARAESLHLCSVNSGDAPSADLLQGLHEELGQHLLLTQDLGRGSQLLLARLTVQGVNACDGWQRSPGIVQD